MRRLIPSILIAAIIALVGFASQAVHSNTDHDSVVFIVDRHALSGTTDGVDSAKSVIGLVTTLRPDAAFTFVGADDPSGGVGPMLTTDDAYSAFQGGLSGWLLAPGAAGDVDVLGAVAEIAAFMDATLAPAGSTVYVIGGESAEGDLTKSSTGAEGLATTFQNKNWRYVSAGLGEQHGQLAALADKLGGEHFDLSALEGYRALTNSVLRLDGRPALANLGGAELTSSDSLALAASAVPGTQEMYLIAFKQNGGGRVTLTGPSGTARTTGDGVSSFLVETANVVIWRLVEPEPGEWQLHVRGVDGSATAWHYSLNVYRPVLLPLGTTPLNEPGVLTAYVEHKREMVMAGGVEITAQVRTPGGEALQFDLEDNGVTGDKTAGDGYFSATIPPLVVEGRYQVYLELTWPGIDQRIASQSEFRTLAFPSIDVTTVRTEGLKVGQREKVGEVAVSILGQPYAVASSELISAVAADGPAGTLELVPQQLVAEDLAWKYDIFFTPESDALHTLDMRLHLVYAGRPYTKIAGSVLLSSVQAAVQPVPPMPDTTVRPTAPTGPTPEQPPPAPGNYWGLLTIPAVMLVALIGATIYWLTRRSPFGYIFDDEGNMVVDFANLEREGRYKLFSKDAVGGREIPIIGLDGVAFTFTRRGVGLQNREMARNVRVNNLPLVSEVSVKNETVIGTEGKLYSFMMLPIPPTPMGDAAGGDGD